LKLVKDIIVYGLSSSLTAFAGFFLVPLYTRVFNPEDFGAIDVITTVVFFCSIVGMMQIESAAARFYFSIKDLLLRKRFISTGFTAIVVLSSIVTIIILVSSDFISRISFGDESYSLAIVLGVLHIPFSNINNYFNILIRFRKKPLIFLAIQSVQVATTFGVILYLLLQLDFGIKGVFIGELSGFVVGATISGIYLREEYSLNFSKVDFKEIFRYSAPLVPAVAGGWANNSLNRFVMLRYLTLVEIGLYSAAFKIASVMYILSTAIRMAWGPFFWETFEKGNHKEIFKKMQFSVSLIVFIVVIFVTFSSDYIVKFMMTPEYYGSVNLIGLIAFSIGINQIILSVTASGPAIVKKTEQNTVLYFSSVIVNIGLLLLIIGDFGLYTVALSFYISSTFLLIISWWNSERLYKIGYKYTLFTIFFIITSFIVFWKSY